MGYIVTHAWFVSPTDGKCPFSSGKLVVDALQKIHPTPAMKVGSVLPQTIGVRQMVTMPLSAQGKVLGSLSNDAFSFLTGVLPKFSVKSPL